MGTPYTFDFGMSCHPTRIELFYFDDLCRIAQWVPPPLYILLIYMFHSFPYLYPCQTPPLYDIHYLRQPLPPPLFVPGPISIILYGDHNSTYTIDKSTGRDDDKYSRLSYPEKKVAQS